MCTSKATGIDKISAKIIKFVAPIIANSLTKIFNMAIDTETFPSEWKIARVARLHKKGPRNLLDNYRPTCTSILPVISKIFEKILYEQLYEYLNAVDLLSKHQFGFRRFHSTSSALLDSTKAFDTVNHELLVNKLGL